MLSPLLHERSGEAEATTTNISRVITWRNILFEEG